jgi:hypothetical protein
MLASLLLSLSPQARAEERKLTIDLHGYYRARAVSIRNLANEHRPPGAFHDPDTGKDVLQPYRQAKWSNYLIQKARLEPVLKVGELVKLQLTVDALDNVVWGDNDALATSPLFAGEGTNTSYLGHEPSAVALRRAWLDIDLKVGRLRVGRMASHWGMGLLSHGGGTHGGLEGYHPRDFGDYHFGSIYDRILFATRPVSLVKHLMGYDDVESPIIFAYAYDKLVEDPLQMDHPREFYRPLGESGFLGDDDDDVQEHVFVLLYKDEDFELWRESDSLTFGLYVVIRTQTHSRKEERTTAEGETEVVYTGEGSLVHIWDFWAKARLGPLDLETEWLTILGHTDGGVPIPPALEKDAKIIAGALRLGYLTTKLDGVFEFGYSSGDKDLSDDTFTQRPSHPDYNVGLLLFEEVLRERTARTLARDLSSGLQSNGGVFNASYIFPRVRYRPWSWCEGVLGVLLAWRNEPTMQSGLFDKKRGSFLGAEIDLALKLHWEAAHLFFNLETGYLIFGEALKDKYLLTTDGTIDGHADAWTLQGRLAFEF